MNKDTRTFILGLLMLIYGIRSITINMIVLFVFEDWNLLSVCGLIGGIILTWMGLDKTEKTTY